MYQLFILLLGFAAVGTAETFYVAPNGRDTWSGRLPEPNAARTDGPLATFTAARDRVREVKKTAGPDRHEIVARGGVYRLSGPLVLTAADSGVTYTAYPGEQPILSGGRLIAGWKQGSGKIWTAPVQSGWDFHELFVGGRRAQRARTPNQGFFRIDGPSSQDKPFRLKFHGNEIRPEWAGKGVEVVALLAWSDLRMPVITVDEAAHVATLGADPQPSNREVNARYYIENAPDALDSPGEWYLDRSAGLLSYWPLPDEDLSRAEVAAPVLEQLVRLEHARGVVFRGLVFRHTDWSVPAAGYADMQAAVNVPAAFDAVLSTDCAVEKCVFHGLGGYAVSFGKGSTRDRATGNRMFDLGGGGVKLGEQDLPAAESDRSEDNVVSDNDIHDLGQVFAPAIGIWVGQSSGNVLAHNHIHDLFYTAISVGWTWGYGPNACKGNRIEYNHLHHIGNGMLSDMGAIYTLGIQPGTVIRYNLIHDVASFTYGGWGIYPDEGSTEMLIENNVVYRTKSAGFHQHYGRGNTVRNNIFAFGAEYQVMRTRAEQHQSFVFERNIVYFDRGHLLGQNWTDAPWPGCGTDCHQFLFRDNLIFDARGEPFALPPNSSGTVVADPGFENAESYDFRLRPDSAARKIGFQQIDLSEVGPRVRMLR
jgi:hypothetical protein